VFHAAVWQAKYQQCEGLLIFKEQPVGESYPDEVLIRRELQYLKMGSKTILIALPCGPREKLPLPPRVPAFTRILNTIKVEVELDEDDPGFQKTRKRRLESISNDDKILRK
jgi:hypothetical protein